MGQHNDQEHDERRKSVRVQKHQHAEIIFEGEVIGVQMMNISEGGVRFVVDRVMKKGTPFTFMLDGAETESTVHECRELFKGYAIRSEFVDF